MTIDEAAELINNAKKGEHLKTALKVVPKLDEMDQLIAGGDLEEMAITLDGR